MVLRRAANQSNGRAVAKVADPAASSRLRMATFQPSRANRPARWCVADPADHKHSGAGSQPDIVFRLPFREGDVPGAAAPCSNTVAKNWKKIAAGG